MSHLTTRRKSLSLSFIISFILTSICQGQTVLAHKNILVTAPSIYNNRFVTSLESKGGKAIPFPIIETNLIEHNTSIDPLLTAIQSYDWIILPSRNAIKAYFQRAVEIHLADSLLQRGHYSAIGKDQEYLKSFGINSILKHTQASPQGIFEAIKSHNSKQDCKVAVLTPKVIGMPEPNVVPDFIDSLKSAHIEVTRIDAYTTKVTSPSDQGEIITEIKTGKIDLIAFTSTAEIQAMIHLCGGLEPLSHTTIACFGPYTYKNAVDLGLHPAFMAKDYSSFEGFTQAIIEYYDK